MKVDFVKNVFFIACLLVISLNALASISRPGGFQQHEPNTPPANWARVVKPNPTPNPVAYFRDDAVAAVHMITGATAGETWTVEVLQPKADGTPGGPVLTLAFPTITYSGGCFRAPRMASVCGSPNWGIRWFIQSQCKPTGTWTFNLKNKGVVFKSAMVDILPKVNDVNVLARQFAENQGGYLQSYDGICHPKTGSKAVNCQDKKNATPTPYTIAAKGCAITSVDMVMKYHGRSTGFAASPFNINSFLDRSPNVGDGGTLGYDATGNIKWAKIKGYLGGNVTFDKRLLYRDDKLLRQKLCKYGPTPISVVRIHPNGRKSGHYVVATGIANEGTPSQTFEVLDPDGGVATTLTQKYGNNYTGIRSYKGPQSVWTSDNGIDIRVYSPVQLLLTDPQGRRTGYDRVTGHMVSEIPGGSYGEEPEVSLDPTFSDPDPMKDLMLNHNVMNGSYKLDVIGTGSGVYKLSIYFDDNNGNSIRGKTFRNVPVTPGAVHTYTFNYNSTPGSVITVTGGLPVLGVNNPPIANAGPNQAVECVAGFANATLNGAGSSDPNGDPLTYAWFGPFGTATGSKPVVNLPLGTHTITLTVNDGKGGTATATTQVTVQDTTPPVVNAGANVTIPATGPNGAPFSLQPTVSDACCTVNVVTSPQLALYPVGTTPITATATDCAGNTSSSTMQLTVQAAGAPPVPPAPNPGNGGGQPGAGTNPPPPDAGNGEAAGHDAEENEDETEYADEDHAKKETRKHEEDDHESASKKHRHGHDQHSKQHGRHQDDTGVEGLE